jgi:outer membrane protein assembly factor BamD
MSPARKSRKGIIPGRIILFCLAALMILDVSACARKKKKTAPPVEELYQNALVLLSGRPTLLGKKFPAAREKYKDTWNSAFYTRHNYTRALEAFKKVIYHYPFSRYAILAELRIADCHFELKEYETAAEAYKDFIRFHPVHQETSHATYRLGLCYYHQMLRPGRDQTNTEKALTQFILLKSRYPECQYVEKAESLIHDCEERLAKHKFGIGRFYYRQKNYWAASARFQKVWQECPEAKTAEKALFKQAQCQDRLNRYENALVLYKELLSRFPDGKFREQADTRMKELEKKTDKKK